MENRNYLKGFASMEPERVRELARMGGKAAINRHKFTHDEAVAAGKKGGGRPRKTSIDE